MSERLMIIVSGAPATGKTTLSKNIAKKFDLPLVNKDELKELLFDNLGLKDTDWAVKLGIASFELLFLLADKLAQTGKPFIVEGNFDNRFSTKSFIDMKTKHNYSVLHLHCHAEEKILYERYVSRDNSGDRHPGHIRLEGGFEDFKNTIIDRPFKLLIEDSETIEIDTTRFNEVDLDKISNQVKSHIALSYGGYNIVK
jgi:predicted kinase